MWRKRITVLAVATAMAIIGAAPAALAGYQGEPLFGDLNGDGIADRAILDGGGPTECGVQVALGNGSGGYGPATTYTYEAPGDYVHCPDMGVVVDLGGDGTVELVLAWFDGRPPGVETDLLVLRDYQPVGGFDAIYQPSYIGLADFNGDGRQDVYQWTDQGAGFLTYLNTASGQLVPGPVKWPCGWAPDYRLADFNRNGASDVLISYAGDCGEYDTGVVVVLDNGTVVHLEGDPAGDDYWSDRDAGRQRRRHPRRASPTTTSPARSPTSSATGAAASAPRHSPTTTPPRPRAPVRWTSRCSRNDLATSAAKITIVTPPKYGKLQITSRRTVLYTPNGSHTQTDKFVYRLSADGKSDVAGVTIRVKR